MKWKNVGKTEKIDLMFFRQMLGIEENQYKAMKDFKKVVLDVAIAQINERTRIYLLIMNNIRKVALSQALRLNFDKNRLLRKISKRVSNVTQIHRICSPNTQTNN